VLNAILLLILLPLAMLGSRRGR